MATDTAPTPTDQPRRPERVSTREGGRSRSLPALIGDYGAMILLAAFFLFPVVFMVVSSLKPDEQIFADLTSPAAFLPVGDISLANYGAAFERIPAWRFLGNSFFVTVVTVILGLIVNSMAGFALSRMRWRGRKIVFAIIIVFVLEFRAGRGPAASLTSECAVEVEGRCASSKASRAACGCG